MDYTKRTETMRAVNARMLDISEGRISIALAPLEMVLRLENKGITSVNELAAALVAEIGA